MPTFSNLSISCVQIDDFETSATRNKVSGMPVAPSAPLSEQGIYWYALGIACLSVCMCMCECVI
jgi:hypothetical protein